MLSNIVMGIVFQFEEELWAVNLKNQVLTQPVLDPEVYKMMPRYAVRRPFDKDQIYCLAEKGTRYEVLRIRFESDGTHVEPIYESTNAKLLALEPDPEHINRLFIVDEE